MGGPTGRSPLLLAEWRLGRWIELDEGGCQSAEALKVAQAVLTQIIEQGIKVGDAVLEYRDALTVHMRLPVEVEHRTSADDGIQCHQLPFVRAGETRPAFAAVLLPE